MKVHISRLSERQRIQTLDGLYTAAASLKGRAAMKLFLRDLLTEGERIMLGRRIIIARRLLSGGGYREIASELGAGYDTIRRVHRWLSDQFPGYETALAGLADVERERKFRGHTNWRATLARLKRKYPVHFLFFPNPNRRVRASQAL